MQNVCRHFQRTARPTPLARSFSTSSTALAISANDVHNAALKARKRSVNPLRTGVLPEDVDIPAATRHSDEAPLTHDGTTPAVNPNAVSLESPIHSLPIAPAPKSRVPRRKTNSLPRPGTQRELIEYREHRKRLVNLFTPLGSTQTRDNTWQPHHSLHRPPSPSTLTLSTLVAAGAHMGHTRQLTQAPFLPYIYGSRAGISIIDLDQTLPLLRRAANVTRAIVESDGIVLFVGTSDQLRPAVRKAAERLGPNGFQIDSRWLPGLLTNPHEVFGEDVATLMNVKPDLVVFLNPLQNVKAIRECAVLNIPTIGIIDTNADPRLVMYPIPANDESVRTAELVAGTLSLAGKEGLENRLRKRAAQEKAQQERDQKVIDNQQARQREAEAFQ